MPKIKPIFQYHLNNYTFQSDIYITFKYCVCYEVRKYFLYSTRQFTYLLARSLFILNMNYVYFNYVKSKIYIKCFAVYYK